MGGLLDYFIAQFGGRILLRAVYLTLFIGCYLLWAQFIECFCGVLEGFAQLGSVFVVLRGVIYYGCYLLWC